MDIHRIFGIATIFFVLAYRSAGQEIVLDPVTVSTTLVEKRSSETGRNITVIRQEDLKNYAFHSLDELIRFLPGIEVQMRGPMGAQSDIILRGGTFQQVLVVVDGLRINDPVTGHFNSYIPIPVSEIARIEILKGSSSSVYGSEAVGGVISVITKTFARGRGQESDNTIQGSLTSGAFGLISGQVGGYFRDKNVAVSGGLISNNASGPKAKGTRGYFHNHTASVAANYRIDDHYSVSYRSSFDSRDFSARNFYTAFPSDTATEIVSGWWHQLEVLRKKRNSEISLLTSYKKTDDHYSYNSLSVPNQNQSGLFQALATGKTAISDFTDVSAGVHFQQKMIRSNDRGNHQVNQLAPFLLVSHRIGALSLHPSLRLDWREGIGTELVPALSISYKIENWQLRANGGKTIRDPDFTERFNNNGKKLVTGGSVGNPELKAETAFAYELGFDWFYKRNWKVSATYFQRNHRNMIDYIPRPFEQMPRRENLSPAGSFALAENIAEVTTRGVEADIQFVFKHSERQTITGLFGATLLRSRQYPDVRSFYLSSHARLLLNTTWTWKYKKWLVTAGALYKEREPRTAPAGISPVEKRYLLLNSRIGYDLIPAKFQIFVQADNLTDKTYTDLLGAAMPGRWIMGGLRFQI